MNERYQIGMFEDCHKTDNQQIYSNVNNNTTQQLDTEIQQLSTHKDTGTKELSTNNGTGTQQIGSLLQLAAKGPQDDHIHADGTSFLFKSEYSRHTNFATENDFVEFKNVSLDSSFIYEIPHKGDFLKSVILYVKLPVLPTAQRYNNELIAHLIKKVKIYIDDEVLCEYDGLFIHIYNILNNDESKIPGYKKLSSNTSRLYIPLLLWDSTSLENFIPLSAFKLQKLRIKIDFAHKDDLWMSRTTQQRRFVKPIMRIKGPKIRIKLNVTVPDVPIDMNQFSISAFTDFILLSNDEQKQLNNENKTVFPQIIKQQEKLSKKINKIELHFNIPIKQLIWIITDNETIDDDINLLSFSKAKIILNNAKIENSMNYYSYDYFKILQNYYHGKRYTNENIFTYSFALQPFYGHPTGTIDFAKLQTKILEIHGNNLENKWITIYACGINILETSEGKSQIKLSM